MSSEEHISWSSLLYKCFREAQWFQFQILISSSGHVEHLKTISDGNNEFIKFISLDSKNIICLSKFYGVGVCSIRMLAGNAKLSIHKKTTSKKQTKLTNKIKGKEAPESNLTEENKK